jgi:ABC-2 type transport system ATP-binding protein
MPAAASDPAISVVGLAKHYGTTRAVDGLSFDVARGEVFGLLGPNGAGKTTTVETLEGYRTPDLGTVRVLGLDPVRDAAQLRPRIGVMLQEGGLYPGLKPLELLQLFAAYYDEAESPVALLETVGLGEAAHTAVRRLSGGQRQRLSLACALIGRPEVVFLDEPTAGMDPHARATTWQLVRDLRDRGVTVLLTTHAMDEAEQLCDRVAIVTGGKLAALGSPAELTQHAVADEIWFAADPGLDAGAIGRALGLPDGAVAEDRPGEYVVQAAGTPGRIADLACFLRDRNVTLAALQAGRRSLEEVFLQITAEEAR